ncbi:MAG: ATP-binding protein [Candidatus Coatesbacteria bacterium]|nr:ATP-binding protein [Candidatus Coatesbacteria bacterium]
MSLNKPLEDINENDLQYYVDSKVVERRTLEYKEALPGKNDEGKKEFLADVSSFANAAGGHIIYGITQDDNGEPKELSGLGEINVDDARLHLENLMRDCLAPRIPRVGIQPVALTTGSVAMVIRIGTSWALPHVVSWHKHWRFYSRNSAGKYPLDVQELRSLFALSETRAEWIRNFRAERLARILGPEPPVALPEGAKLVLHLVPLSAPDPAASYDVTLAHKGRSKLGPIGSGDWRHRYNFDGCLLFDRPYQGPYSESYLQFLRNGILEGVTTRGLHLASADGTPVPLFTFENRLLERLPGYLEFMKEVCVELPIAVMISLLGVRGHDVYVDRREDTRSLSEESRRIERNDLIIPETLVESWDTGAETILRPSLDAVWNACGFSRCLLYDKDGKWRRDR